MQRKNEESMIERLNGVESYKVPEMLMEMLLNPQSREALFTDLRAEGPLTGKDGLRDLFQQEHGDREKLKQDYTPDCLTELVARLVPKAESYADVCAGTGALSLSIWAKYPAAYFYCEELASRAIPFLLCNLGVRNINSMVRQTDALIGETKESFLVDANGIRNGERELQRFPVVIMNPPYSIKWKPVKAKQFEGFEPLPTNAADFAFVLHGSYLLEEGGTLIAILPHGILFRGNKEAEIRQKLLERNLIDAVIGLPENMFMNTGIPVCLLILKKNRTAKNVLFIDASKGYEKVGKHNVMQEEHLEKIVATYHTREEVERFAHLATAEEIRGNDYNLNIPRYVDTFLPEVVPRLDDTLKDIRDLDVQITDVLGELTKMTSQLTGSTSESEKEIRSAETMMTETFKRRKQVIQEESNEPSLF